MKKQLLEFVKDNKIWVLSIAVPLLGAIPLYIYSMSVGELPDFSLSDLTGALIASFLTELVIAALTVCYVLFAGFAARNAVSAFYPETPSGPPPANRTYLIRGNFIQGVTVFCVLAWFGLVTTSFDRWLIPPATWLARTAYWGAICSSALLVIFDWRNGKRRLKYTLFFILTGSIAFLAVLVWASLCDYAPVPHGKQGAQASSSVPLAKATTWAADAGAWLLHDHLVATATITALVAGAVVSYIATVTRGRRQANRSGQPPRPSFKNERLNLLAAKGWITFVFCLFSAIPLLLLYAIVDATPTRAQVTAAIVGGSYLLLLNWFSFSARDWKQRGMAAAGAFLFVFVMLPLQSNNATLLPKMVVSALGSGNRHATNLVLASTECPALVPYGINCKAEKDSSIGITNVNILNRLGSTVLIELQVQRVMAPSATPQKQRQDVPASEPHGAVPPRTNLVPLTLRVPKAGTPHTDGFLASYSCDDLRLERLRAVDPAKADSLACVKLSVPKDHMLGHTVNGAATYLGDFSQYVQTTP
ncbi:hypothetical protein [Paraburkholderia sp. SUR17]|uniref:hypothetical protein n=1 Tax=Paraburkholderia sp. SUR17 TaxID=3034358 RepID=UPI00240784BB|nr:hypothetical protein [Paraburkholderia sp. SUR17]WEY37770.1 hypothetical protein P2869_11855 [Paraburkholderia sp. SUR17]